MVMMYAKIATLTSTLRGAFGVASFLTRKKSIGSSATTSPLPSPTCSCFSAATFPSAPSTPFSRFDHGDGAAAAAAESLSGVVMCLLRTSSLRDMGSLIQ